jgi:hypothetical protein
MYGGGFHLARLADGHQRVEITAPVYAYGRTVLAFQRVLTTPKEQKRSIIIRSGQQLLLLAHRVASSDAMERTGRGVRSFDSKLEHSEADRLHSNPARTTAFTARF